MNALKLIIADIQTTNLLFYDPAYGKQGYKFCHDRDIDCLPSIDNPSFLYYRNDETQDFEPVDFTEERCVSAHRFVFHPGMLEKFKKYPILFVIEDEELSGVIHFSDYNKPIISSYLYNFLATYERNLRQLASLFDLSDENMGDYFQFKLRQREAKGKDGSFFERRLEAFHRQQQNQSPQIPQFQQYYLDDLIGLLKHHDIIKLQGAVTQLRNSVMHAHEMVNMVDAATPDYIYDIVTFETFFKRVRALLDDARRVENRIRFVQDMNQVINKTGE